MTTQYELAVVGKQLSSLSPQGDAHTFNFTRLVTTSHFKNIMFAFKNGSALPSFGPKQDAHTYINHFTNTTCKGYSITTQFDTMDKAYESSTLNEFDLKECLLACANADLDLPFTPISIIQWTKEVNEIEYLSDLKIVTSLRLKDVTIAASNSFYVTIVFTSENCQILPVILRIRYLLSDSASEEATASYSGISTLPSGTAP